MTRKNIADKMIAEYNAIRLEKDEGKKLLKLAALKTRVADLVDNKKVEVSYEKALGIPAIVGVGVGALLVSTGLGGISAGAVVTEYVLASLLSGCVCALGGLAMVTGHESKINKTMNDRRAARYVKNVLPHLPALKSLAKEIENDRNTILKSDHVLSLQDSPHLSNVLKAYPSLLETFKAAQNAQPLPEINAAPEVAPPKMTL